MIKIQKTYTAGWEHALRGMRNPMNSWNKSDSTNCKSCMGCIECPLSDERCFEDVELADDFVLGKNDKKLCMNLAANGPVHAKYRRMIVVYADIIAPLYWWKEYDTYKVGTVANSCSTMHKIAEKEFEIDDFSHEHLITSNDVIEDHKNSEIKNAYSKLLAVVTINGETCRYTPLYWLKMTCDLLNYFRELYLKTKDKRYWWQMIQLLPSSYNQKRTVMLNYEVLSNIYKHRADHKLDEWIELCRWIEKLPYSELITGLHKENANGGEV